MLYTFVASIMPSRAECLLLVLLCGHLRLAQSLHGDQRTSVTGGQGVFCSALKAVALTKAAGVQT